MSIVGDIVEERDRAVKVIYKYELSFPVSTVVTDPHARLLNVDIQSGVIMVWALVDPERDVARDVNHEFLIVGTGWEFDPKQFTYYDTVQINGLVWHVFGTMEKYV